MNTFIVISVIIYVLGLILCPFSIRKYFKHFYFPLLYFYTNYSQDFQVGLQEASTSITIIIIFILVVLVLALSYLKYIDYTYEAKMKNILKNMEIAFRKMIAERDYHQENSRHRQIKIDLLANKLNKSELEYSAIKRRSEQLQTDISERQIKLIQSENECSEYKAAIKTLLIQLNLMEKRNKFLSLKVEEHASIHFKRHIEEKNKDVDIFVPNAASKNDTTSDTAHEDKTKVLLKEIDFLFFRSQQIMNARKAGVFSDVNLLKTTFLEDVSEVGAVIPQTSYIKDSELQGSYQRPAANIKLPFLFRCKMASKDLLSYVKLRLPFLNFPVKTLKRKQKSILSIVRPRHLRLKY